MRKLCMILAFCFCTTMVMVPNVTLTTNGSNSAYVADITKQNKNNDNKANKNPETAWDVAFNKVLNTFQNARRMIFIIGGFGLIALAFFAIFGKIRWTWFASLCVGLGMVAAAGLIIDYVTVGGTSNAGSEESEKNDPAANKKEKKAKKDNIQQEAERNKAAQEAQDFFNMNYPGKND